MFNILSVSFFFQREIHKSHIFHANIYMAICKKKIYLILMWVTYESYMIESLYSSYAPLASMNQIWWMLSVIHVICIEVFFCLDATK